MNRHFLVNRRGMTLLDVLAAMGICLVLSTMVLGGLAGTREAANRAKCASNLRQIALACISYGNTEVRTGAFPRTYYNRTNHKLIVDTTGYGKPSSFDAKATGDNNVTASFFLLAKPHDFVDVVTPEIWVCPSTLSVPGFGKDSKIKPQNSSNWEAIPRNLSYSYSCPFPTDEAVSSGWKFNTTLGSDVPLAADLNPGGDALLKLTPKSTQDQLRAGNSHNHNGDGQNVAYCDGHVEFQATPFCGSQPNPPAAGESASRDNIYTYGGPSDTKGGVGVVGMPVNFNDRVLLPAGDASAAAGK